MTQETVSNPPAQNHTNVAHSNGSEAAARLAHFKAPTGGKKTVRVHLHFPTHDREVIVKKKLRLDGRYRDVKSEIDVPLMPGMAVNGGADIHIDAERGVQVKYAGLAGWVGIDGRWSFAAEVRKHLAALQTRGLDFTKYLWPATIVISVVFGSIVVIAALGMGK